MPITGEANIQHLAEVFGNALNWLNVVGEYDHEIPKTDNKFTRGNTAALRYLGDQMAAGDYDTAVILSTMEMQARDAKSELSWVPDEDAQNSHRTSQFYSLAKSMVAFQTESASLQSN